MKTNGRWHNHSDGKNKKKSAYRFKRYTTPDCKNCRNRSLCTGSKTNGRYIDRSEYADTIEANAQRVKNDPEYYRLRQQITEHMFGTMKRQQGFTYTLVRTRKKVMGEVGLMFTGYNLCRCISVMGAQKLIRLLREYCFLIISDLRRFISLALKDYFPSNKDILVLCHLKLVVSNPLTVSRN